LRYLFDDCALDTDRRELRRGAALIPVTPQVFDLLEYLIRNRERVVSKDDLIAAIWGGRIISESALTTRLNVARSVIGDSGDRQGLIKTLARKGIRFVGAVREERTTKAVPIAEFSPKSPRPARIFSDKLTIAVVPFTSMSSDLHRERYGCELAEDLSTELSKLRWLLVAARTLGFTHPADARQSGGELGVRYLLQGSVRRLADRIRITAQLIDTVTSTHIWAERYDRKLADTIAAHDELTQAMVLAIAPAILQAERKRLLQKLPENLVAWEAYQRGMWHMSKCDAAENGIARTFFQRAIDLDPHYAPSYSALAWSYMMSASIFSEMTVAEGCALGEPLVRKAIALDEDDAEARARLALTSLLRGDIEGAIEDVQQVLSVKANCADAIGVKGAALIYSGHRREGREALQQFLRLSPRDPARPIRLSQIATSLYLDGEYERAAQTARHVIRQYPKHPNAYRWLAASLGQLGRTAEAEEALQTLLTTSPSSFDMYVRQRPPQYCSVEYTPMLQGLRKAGWKG
jgi:adenylate cyclase